MTAVLQDQPLPARLLPWPAARFTPLARCLLLALLLHLWLVLMLGSAPGGTAQPGQGVFGAINITLRGPVSETARDSAPAATPAPGVAPDSDSARWGGRVRQTERPVDAVPGAERLGVPMPQAPRALPIAPERLESPAPVPPAAPLASLPDAALPTPAPAAVERRIATPVLPAVRSAAPALAREPEAAALPDLQALPTPGAAPAPLRQLPTPAAAAPRAAEAALPRTAPAETVTLPNLPTTPITTPTTLPAPGTLVNSPGLASPDAGSRVGHDVATPAASAASQPPRLNLELARPRGGELSRLPSSGALPVLPRPPEVDDKLGREIDKSGKTDCRKAYAGAGILAVVPLAVDTLRSGGCKW